MNRPSHSATTSIAVSTPEDVFIRDRSLCNELIGELSFTQMIYWGVLGRMATTEEDRLLDACLVTLMEHGLTPSALAARLVYSIAPEAMQAAVAAGLCGVGSLFAGTTEGAGELLRRMLTSALPLEEEAMQIAQEHRQGRKPLPGFGHPQHKPDDPRSVRLLALAEQYGIAGRHVGAVRVLGKAVDATYGRHITLNATGAIAAVLGDLNVPYEIFRGFALIARTAGLVAHIHEEQQKPALLSIWHAAEHAVPYDGQKAR
jgi:citrate synthase